jgi:hypothetical protein
MTENCRWQRRRLLSSAQEVTDVPVTITAVGLHDEVIPGAQSVCIRGYICRSPPPACQYTEGVPPSPHCGARREMRLPETAAGPVRYINNLNIPPNSDNGEMFFSAYCQQNRHDFKHLARLRWTTGGISGKTIIMKPNYDYFKHFGPSESFLFELYLQKNFKTILPRPNNGVPSWQCLKG